MSNGCKGDLLRSPVRSGPSKLELSSRESSGQHMEVEAAVPEVSLPVHRRNIKRSKSRFLLDS